MNEEKKRGGLLVYIVVIIILAGGWYYFNKTKNKNTGNESTTKEQQVNDQEKKGEGPVSFPEGTDPVVKETITQLSKHILLPSGDIQVATVTDAEEFKKQDPLRLQYVQNGYKLIQTVHGIIIFNQEIDKIVDVIRVYPEIKTDQEKTQ